MALHDRHHSQSEASRRGRASEMAEGPNVRSGQAGLSPAAPVQRCRLLGDSLMAKTLIDISFGLASIMVRADPQRCHGLPAGFPPRCIQFWNTLP